jgi:flagellar motor switch protein FliN
MNDHAAALPDPHASTALLAPEAPDGGEPRARFALEVEQRVFDACLTLAIQVPVRKLRVKDILALAAERVIETAWPVDEDIPGICGGVQLLWTEFEVIDKKLAVRVTRVA